MHVVAGQAPHLPPSLVRLPPVGGDKGGERAQQAAVLLAEPPTKALVEQSQVEHLPVDVDLALAEGAVTEPHRPAAPVAFEVIEYGLPQIALALHAVQNLHDRQG